MLRGVIFSRSATILVRRCLKSNMPEGPLMSFPVSKPMKPLATRNPSILMAALTNDYSTEPNATLHCGTVTYTKRDFSTAKKKGRAKQEKGAKPVEAKKHGAVPHSKLWFIEKSISIALIPTTLLMIAFPNIVFDLIFVLTVIGHIHWGIVATIIDYVRPIIFGNQIAHIGLLACYGISIFICLGLINVTIRGQGIGNSIHTLWSM